MPISFRFLPGVLLGLAATIGSAQAITLTPIADYKGDMSWQDIAGTSYTWADTNHDGKVSVGETVTFTVDMHKTYWGTHAFDALKVWIDATPLNLSGPSLYTGEFKWIFDKSGNNQKWFNKPGDPYSWKPWTKGDRLFSFDYTFTKAGTYDLTASATCSRDLSAIVGKSDDKPTAADWKGWKEDFHTLPGWRQGETERYQLTVAAVPEPETYGMMMAGLGVLGAVARRRKAKQ